MTNLEAAALLKALLKVKRDGNIDSKFEEGIDLMIRDIIMKISKQNLLAPWNIQR